MGEAPKTQGVAINLIPPEKVDEIQFTPGKKQADTWQPPGACVIQRLPLGME
jgi:hypothetical protein